MQRGHTILKTLQFISANDTKLMEFLLDEQFYTPTSSMDHKGTTTKVLPSVVAGATVISKHTS